MIKLGICIPHRGDIKIKTAFSLIRMMKLTLETSSISPIYLERQGSILHSNREELVKKAIELDCTHILFVDTDMIFPENAVIQLLERDKEIIGVPYNLKQIPSISTRKIHAENGKIIDEEYPNGLRKCAGIGTGFILIKTEVFKKISHPWFFWESDEKGKVLTGEDMWFCRKARQIGFDIWCDMTISIKHIGDYEY